MFRWFGRKTDHTKDLIKILKQGLTVNINVNISDNTNAQERRNSLEKKQRENKIQPKIKEDEKRTRTEDITDSFPNFKKLEGPTVQFGEEGEV